MRRILGGLLCLCASMSAHAVSLAFAGDLMLGSEYPEGFMPPDDGRNLLSEVAPVFKASEINFANLEGIVSDRKLEPRDCGASTRCFRFRMPSKLLGAAKEAGINIVSNANNHVFDFGPDGITDTAQALKAAGLLGVGSLANPTQIVVAKDGTRVGFFAVAPHLGAAPMLDAAYVKETIVALRKQVDLLIVSMHAGAEGAAAAKVTGETEMYLGANRGNVQAFAKEAVDNGADLVIGHGPHVLRGMECYRGKLLAYSLGNFATFGLFNLAPPLNLGGILQVNLTAKGVEGQLLGFEQSHRSTGQGPKRSEVPEKFLLELSRENFGEKSAVGLDGKISCGARREEARSVREPKRSAG